jgi:hypothetical protein
VVIRFRPHFAPQFLLGFLLWWIGFGAILLVIAGLSSRSTAIGLGELAVAGSLVVIFGRIWRTSEGARWVAGLFALFRFPGLWLPSNGDITWLDAVYGFVLVAISVGLWRAQQWARWAAAVVSTLSSIWSILVLVHAQREGPPLSPTTFLVGFFALFWAAIALYLLLPSTGVRFSELHAARS